MPSSVRFLMMYALEFSIAVHVQLRCFVWRMRAGLRDVSAGGNVDRFCRLDTALRAILMPSCVAAGLDIGICITNSRHCSSLRKSNSVSRSHGFGSLSGSGAFSGSGLACARFGSLTFLFHQAISSGVRRSWDCLRSGRPRRCVGSG